jgi:hypothetical protein
MLIVSGYDSGNDWSFHRRSWSFGVKEMVGLSPVLMQHHLVPYSMVMRCDMCGVWGEGQLQVIVGLSLSLSPPLQPRMIDANGYEPIAG